MALLWSTEGDRSARGCREGCTPSAIRSHGSTGAYRDNRRQNRQERQGDEYFSEGEAGAHQGRTAYRA